MKNKTLARAALLLACAFAGLAAAAPQVEMFTPRGEAKGVRQVAVRFSEPMVAFGDLRLAEPFTVRCEGEASRLKGRGRWADTRNWAYDFEADLPAGQRCTFTLKPDLKSAKGDAVTGEREFSFHTGGPAVMVSLPNEGHSAIDDEQWFLLAFDAPVDAASLERGAWCEAKGVNERIPLKVLDDSETRKLVEANKESAFRLYRAYLKGRRAIPIAQFKIEDKRWKDLPVLGVRCGRKLPSGAEMGLVIGESVATKSGIKRGTPQRLAYGVRETFRVRFTCERANKDAACLPVTPMRLEFNSPVAREKAAAIRLKTEHGWTSIEPVLEKNVNTVESVEFAGPFPEKTQYKIVLPGGFADDAGREPENKASFPLSVGTDEYPPLVKFPGRFGILELNADPILPVTVRSVEPKLAGKQVEPGAAGPPPIPGKSARMTDDESRIISRYLSFIDRRYEEPVEKELKRGVREGEVSAIAPDDTAVAFDLPRPGGEKPMEVIGIPIKKPGFYVVELASPRLGQVLHGEAKPYYVSTSVLVTNLAVHIKHGRERSIVWVTTLDSGKPVPKAIVSVRDCRGQVHFTGETDASGIADAADKLPPAQSTPRCRGTRALFAFARAGEDLSFSSTEWNQGIAPWNFNVNANPWRIRPLTVNTVFDRTLFRTGETVGMKHIARVPAGKGFRIPAANELPRAGEIQHLGSGQKYRIEAKFDAQGVADGTWRIPKEAKLGEYRVNWLGRNEVSSNATFRVEAFRVPLMRAALAAPKAAQVRPTSTKIDAAVTYLAGGPAAYLPVKVRHRIEPRGVSFADYPDFQFGGQAVKEGLETGSASDFFSTYDPDEEDSGPEEPGETPGPVTTRSLTLDAAGTAAITIDKLPQLERPASLLVEMEYADPNGELLASATRVALHPAGLYLGLRPEGWAANKDNVRVQLLAVDTAGKPLSTRAISVEAYLRNTYSHRRRLIGGFYAYDSVTETKRLGSGCSGTTDARGIAFCTLKPGASGELILVARAKDESGREAVSSTSVWVVAGGDWWFAPANHDRIDLVPEKKRYEPGETAKFQLRMPFRKATVLVTVEREGVIDQKVIELDGASPVIELPIAGNYGPNVFVSALAVRGRVDPEVPGPYAWLKHWVYRIGKLLGLVDEVPKERDTRPTALVDLAKPAYKLGMAEIKVGRRDYELKVKVAPEKEVLKVRDKVRVSIQVTDAAGKPPQNAEIALAAVDEGLLELKNNESWNLLEQFMGQRPQEVATSTAQGQVIGKRHFGRKALPPGGGGGKGGARELFDTLLLWKARVELDAEGRATIEIPMNDSLSSFKLVAIAHAGEAKFGSGAASVRTTQDLMLFSGLPPLVREGDEFTAMFTLRNTTDKSLPVEFTWKMHEQAGKETTTLAAAEAKVITVPVQVPIGIAKLNWEIAATAGDTTDRLRTTQRVVAVHPVRVYQATLAQLDKPLEFPIERPADAVPGRGGVRVEVMKSIAGELTPVYEYFERYPYTCLEQRVSKAIGLGSEALWRSVSASVPNYLDRDGLAKYFPSDSLLGSDALTAYLIQIADAAQYKWPEESLTRMLGGLESFATGKIIRGSALPTADLTIRKLAVIEALARHGRARPEMLDSITIDPPLWPTSALVDWIGILQRVKNAPQRDQRLKDALSQLRARLNFQGTVMTFSTERNDALWWLMVSADVNANRALLAVLADAGWREDVGRLVRGTLSRQKKGIWGTTVANAWGVVAMGRFSQAFEKTPATGSVEVRVAGTPTSIQVLPKRQQRDFDWPAGRETFSVAHTGRGAPWTIVQSRAAIPLKAPISTGYAIRRNVASVEQKDKAGYSRGDVYRVTLEVEAQTDMTWVVIDDPIPSGAAILGSGLGRDAGSLTAGEKRAGWAWPAFVERTEEAYRAYYEFVPKGKFTLEYTVRLNNPGRFDLPATRVEALYAPEMFGESPNASVQVKP
jgi:alpha-2-macroglobulin